MKLAGLVSKKRLRQTTVAAVIAVVALAHYRFGLDAITGFWLAYILTRPLGASIGDYLSQLKADGGLGLGTTATSLIFLSSILGMVIFLTITKKDQPAAVAARAPGGSPHARTPAFEGADA